MTLIQQQVQSVFATLPQSIRDLITTEDFNDRIEVVAKKYGLNDSQSAELIRATVRLLIGVLPPNQFVSRIVQEAEIDHEVASHLAQDINHTIFNSVKDALTVVHSTSLHPPTSTVGLVRAPATANIPNSAPAPASPFEQKLGGAFRMENTALQRGKSPDPMLVVPPPPRGTVPLPSVGVPPPPQRVDPYRESA